MIALNDDAVQQFDWQSGSAASDIKYPQFRCTNATGHQILTEDEQNRQSPCCFQQIFGVL
jgi:hypothetical protein